MAQKHTNEGVQYSFRLYVTGASSGSSRAIALIKAFCEQFLKGKYLLEVVDVYQQPALADEERIFATPTLVRTSPLPFRRIVGNLSDPHRLQAGLGISL
ncbi:MAG TPA: circadian clock KaiB family protein [Thermoanaerobaculia bacterium]|nr:circadian clock KaiB family protein [Thermoanaerobaculia bacterium]